VLIYHIAGAVLLFRYIFRDPKVDMRLLALGAVLPNLIDKPLGTLIAPDYFQADRLIGHSLLFPTAIMTLVLLLTRRGRRRRAIMALAIGAMLHLLLDGMWASTATFLWPVFGWAFDQGQADYWGNLGGLFTPVAIGQELAGLAYLTYLYRSLGLSDPSLHKTLLTTGRLPA
jgi:membrane-bound metal-dependent hydrolase YbcI (DUF457 family)